MDLFWNWTIENNSEGPTFSLFLFFIIPQSLFETGAARESSHVKNLLKAPAL